MNEIVTFGLSDVTQPNRKSREVDYTFSKVEALADENPEQVFAVTEAALGEAEVTLASRLFEADKTIGEAATGDDDQLTPTSAIVFRMSEFPTERNAERQKQFTFEDRLCGVKCTKITLTFVLRRLTK